MKAIFFILSLLVLSACTTSQLVDDVIPTVPSDGQLSHCSLDSDCIPIPSQCHPDRCINKEFDSAYEKPEVCTEIFLVSAAYEDADCTCEKSVCVNKNKDLAEVEIPSGATKCNFRGTVCAMVDRPVCGHFGDNVQCITAPCAYDATNPCEACANEDVIYWTDGACDET